MSINSLRSGDVTINPLDNRDFADTQRQTYAKEAGVRSAQSAEQASKPSSPQEALAAIIREAARRAGVKSGAEGYSDKDVRAVNEQIRKDADLAQAVALARGMNRRGKGEADDDNAVALDKGAGTGRGDEEKIQPAETIYGSEGAEGGGGVSGALPLARSSQPGFQSNAGPVLISEGDLVVNMLNMFDLDGDGIITVRQFLEYIVRHAGEQSRFNEIELSNLIKILSGSIDVMPLEHGVARQPEDSLLAGDLDAIVAAINNSDFKRVLAA